MRGWNAPRLSFSDKATADATQFTARNLGDGFSAAGQQDDSTPQGNLLGSGAGGGPLLEPLNLRSREVRRRLSLGHAAMLARRTRWIAISGTLHQPRSVREEGLRRNPLNELNRTPLRSGAGEGLGQRG